MFDVAHEQRQRRQDVPGDAKLSGAEYVRARSVAGIRPGSRFKMLDVLFLGFRTFALRVEALR
jgi:hypothetical protein